MADLVRDDEAHEVEVLSTASHRNHLQAGIENIRHAPSLRRREDRSPIDYDSSRAPHKSPRHCSSLGLHRSGNSGNALGPSTTLQLVQQTCPPSCSSVLMR